MTYMRMVHIRTRGHKCLFRNCGIADTLKDLEKALLATVAGTKSSCKHGMSFDSIFCGLPHAFEAQAETGALFEWHVHYAGI